MGITTQKILEMENLKEGLTDNEKLINQSLSFDEWFLNVLVQEPFTKSKNEIHLSYINNAKEVMIINDFKDLIKAINLRCFRYGYEELFYKKGDKDFYFIFSKLQ